MLLPVAALLGLASVAFGAYAEHALRPESSDDALRALETALRYHQIHAAAATAVGLAALVYDGPRRGLLLTAGWAFAVGIALFSGGIYLFVLTETRDWTLSAPFGGATFMAGWAALAVFGLLARAQGRAS